MGSFSSSKSISIDGKSYAQKLLKWLHNKIVQTKNLHSIAPSLAIILIGENPASKIYVNNKIARAKEIGIITHFYHFPENITKKEVEEHIYSLNENRSIHGILIQLPLPKHLHFFDLTSLIHPHKDVDGLHPLNIGKLYMGMREHFLVPGTPQGCLLLIQSILPDLAGYKAVILGRSLIVGRPMASLLLRENCSVEILHSSSRDIQKACLDADILVAAIGKPEMIGKDWIKEGAVIIDVGITRVLNADNTFSLKGDVNFEEVVSKARAITPVPGGVGPMTIACLLLNTYRAMTFQTDVEDIPWMISIGQTEETLLQNASI